MSEQTEKLTVEDADAGADNSLEAELDVYPLRDASEDPGWAVKSVWIWVSTAIFLLLFLTTLFILGLWFD